MCLLPFWTKEIAGIIYTYRFLFNMSPPKLRHLSNHGTGLLIHALWNYVPCNFKHLVTAVWTPCNSCFHIVVTYKFIARKMILESGKEVKITWCQIWAVRQIFQDCPPAALQEFLSVCHFPHYPLSQHDQIWSLNTILLHFDDSSVVPPKLWQADESQLQKHA
jgi:hypothetical protein